VADKKSKKGPESATHPNRSENAIERPVRHRRGKKDIRGPGARSLTMSDFRPANSGFLFPFKTGRNGTRPTKKKGGKLSILLTCRNQNGLLQDDEATPRECKTHVDPSDTTIGYFSCKKCYKEKERGSPSTRGKKRSDIWEASYRFPEDEANGSSRWTKAGDMAKRG